MGSDGTIEGEQLTDWVEDESEGQIVDDIRRKPSIAGDLSRQYMWELSCTGRGGKGRRGTDL